jgi:hypothetical protein
MSTNQGDALETSKPVRKKSRSILFLLLISMLLVVLVGAFFLPVLDGPHMHQHANEAIAVGNLHRLKTLQSNYAAAHPTKGFACELPQLRATAPVGHTYDPDKFLETETYVGYRFAVSGCEEGPNGVVTQYQVTAVPREPGKSGLRAFCTDQTGALWYDPYGSAVNCLAARRPIE